MAEGRIKNTELAAIAAAIRAKNGSSDVYKPGDMAQAIADIPTGSAVLESLSVTQNGSYTPGTGVDGYSSVSVAVPNSYAAADEGKVVSNGALVAQTARSAEITENGTYDTTLNDEVTVNVSGGSSEIVFTQNLLYDTYSSPSSLPTEDGGIYLFGTAANGGSFTDAEILCGNATKIVTTSGWGRALCVIKANSTTISYGRSGNYYNLSEINSNASIQGGNSNSWTSGDENRSVVPGCLYMFLGPQVSAETAGTFSGAEIVAQIIQGAASNGYHHCAVILATDTTLGYSVSGTNYLNQIGLYAENSYSVDSSQ